MGQHRREFTIHSALVAHQSPALNTLVNGELREARDGHAIWESVDEQTFVRFSQFAYTGDYDDAEPNLKLPQDLTDIERDDSDLQAAGSSRDRENTYTPPEYGEYWAASKKKRFKKAQVFWEPPEEPPSSPVSKREHLWDGFKRRSYLDSSPNSSVPAPTHNEAYLDYTEVFLSHSRLYVFAECYGIPGLIKLSLHKLHRTLVSFSLHEERLDDIVELLRYCYADAVPDQLRELVVPYAACNVEKLWNSEEFRKLLETYGELSMTLIGSLLRRLD